MLDAKYPEGAVAESRTGQDPLNTTFWHPMQSFFRVVVNPNSGNFINRKNLPNCSDAQIAQMRHDDTYGAVIHEVGHHLGVHHHFIAKVDEAKPPRNPDGTVKWPEFDSEIYNGVVDCVMRYNAKRSDGRIMEQCTRITSFRYCTKSDTAYYPVNDDRNGKLIAYPSDDCWGQIDVKSDP